MNLISSRQESNNGDAGANCIGLSFLLAKKRDGYFATNCKSGCRVHVVTSCLSLHSHQFNHVISQSIDPLLSPLLLEELDLSYLCGWLRNSSFLTQNW